VNSRDEMQFIIFWVFYVTLWSNCFILQDLLRRHNFEPNVDLEKHRQALAHLKEEDDEPQEKAVVRIFMGR
jgi:hypothetical protein